MVSGNPINITLSLAADTAAVGLAVAAAHEFARAAGLAATTAGQLAIVVEELVANLVDHAGLTAGDSIELTLAYRPGAVQLVLTDPAAPFDPRSAAAPAALPPARGGGAGLALVRAFAQTIDYGRSDDRNRLELHLID